MHTTLVSVHLCVPLTGRGGGVSRESPRHGVITKLGSGRDTFHWFAFFLSAHSTVSKKHLISLLTNFRFIQHVLLTVPIVFRQVNVTTCTLLCNTRDCEQESYSEVKSSGDGEDEEAMQRQHNENQCGNLYISKRRKLCNTEPLLNRLLLIVKCNYTSEAEASS